MTKAPKYIAASIGAMLIVACSSTPDGVIPSDDMANLLADLYTAESIVELNRGEYNDDSSRKALKQTVLLAHGVTSEQLDSSFMWYGQNLDKFIDVHDRVEKILQERIDKSSASGGVATYSESGDSVDTWHSARQYHITRTSPSRMITFALSPDENWQKGDRYTWAMKLANGRQPSRWVVGARYADGKTDFNNGQLSGEGWSRITFRTDTTRKPVQIFGYLITAPVEGEEIYVDSVQLVRKRLHPELSSQQ